jgi:hypothetical protein
MLIVRTSLSGTFTNITCGVAPNADADERAGTALFAVSVRSIG